MSTDVLPATQSPAATVAAATAQRSSGFRTRPMVETRSAGDRRGRRGGVGCRADSRRQVVAGDRSPC